MPRISVLLPVRDAGLHLSASLRSLRRQTFRDFEVLMVDDGSADRSPERLERAARRDSRFRLIPRTGAGLPSALNDALAASRSSLLARHDADDLSHPRRLEIQSAWLARHPEVDVLGCRIALLPRTFAGVGMRRWRAWHDSLLDHDQIACEMLIDSPLAHATALLRREPLESVGGWRERGWPEDLDLWIRLLRSGARFGKVPRVLYAWRQHAASATRADPRNRRARFDALRLHALDHGLLSGRTAATVVGVGTSLERWTELLRSSGRAVRSVRGAAPLDTAELRALRVPLVLVFGAPAARARWRTALRGAGLCEGAEFVFVA